MIITKNFASIARTAPTIIHTSDGRFSVKDIKPGEWDVLVVGVGFASILRSQVLVSPETTVDLGVISAKAGFTIQGTVLDSFGNPAPNAIVRITQTPGPADDRNIIAELSRGNFLAITGDDGNFHIEGVTILSLSDRRMRIEASDTNRKSFPQFVPAGNHRLLFVLSRTAKVVGFVERPSDDVAVIARIPNQSGYNMATLDNNGGFEFDLPEGTYEFYLRRGDFVSKRVRVDVRAGITTHVDFPIGIQ